MRCSTLWIVLAMTGCADEPEPPPPGPIPADPLDSGLPAPSCRECGPGAIRHARELFGGLAVGPADQVVRVVRQHVLWLDADFAVAGSKELGTRGNLVTIAVDATGDGVALDYLLRGERDLPELSLVGVDRDAADETFEQRIASFSASLAISADHVFVLSDDHTKRLVVHRRSDGGVAAMVDLPGMGLCKGVNHGQTRIAAHPDGAIIAGSFTGTLALGGTAPVLVSTGCYSGYVAAVDASGRGRWAIALDASGIPDASAGVASIAVDDTGNVALAGEWIGTSLRIGGVSLASEGPNVIVALLDAGGAVRWARGFRGGATYAGFGVATDGATVFLGGSYTFKPSVLDPAGLAPIDTDGFAAAFGADGLRWIRFARGVGDQRLSLVGRTSRGLVAAIDSMPTTHGDVSMTYGDVEIAGDARIFAELVAGP